MQRTILPPHLQPGDTIGITAPAGYVSADRVAGAVQVLQGWGFKVKSGATIGTGEFYFSGTDEARLADLQAMLDDREVKAVLMGRGGYGCSRIIDALDFSAFVAAPKWICGFSDITVLHSHIHQCFDIATLHSPMCGAITAETRDEFYIQSLLRALLGGEEDYSFPAHPVQRAGSAEGVLVGGNLAILAHLTGSISQLDTRGKILFIEDIGEHLYNIDRLLVNLKRSGQLEHLAGLVCGSFTDMEDTERPYGKSLEEIILQNMAGYNFPVAFGLPCGHDPVNVTLRLGQQHTLRVSEKGGMLSVVL